MAQQTSFHKVVIGRAEFLEFVKLTSQKLPVKVDTGAYRSAVHASNIRVKNEKLECDLLKGHPVCPNTMLPISTKHFKKVRVLNSFGDSEERYETRLRVKVGPKIFTADFTLADRSKNTYPVLLGRKLLNRRFIVDPARSAVNRSELKKKYAIELEIDEEAEHESR
jgi:hypothetical protein